MNEKILKLRELLKSNKIDEAKKYIEYLYNEEYLYNDIANCLEQSINEYKIENDIIYFVLGTIYGHLGEYDKSIVFLKKAIDLFNLQYNKLFMEIPWNKNNNTIYENINKDNINSVIDMDNKTYSNFMIKLTELFSSHISATINLAINYIHKKNNDEALNILNQTYESPLMKQIKKTPCFHIINTPFNLHFYSLLYHRAKILIKVNKIDEALKDLNELLAIGINQFPVQLLISYIYILKREYQKAIDAFNEAKKLICIFLNNNKFNNNIKYQYISEIHKLYIKSQKTDDNKLKEVIKEEFDSIFESFIKKEIENYRLDTNVKIENNSLFYYTTYNENHTPNTIEQEYLYISDPDGFNDSIDPIIRYINDEVSKVILDKIGIACLATSPYDILMWGHYGDKSYGMCIEYDISDLLNKKIENIAFVKMQYLNLLEYNEDDLYFESVFTNGTKKSLQLIDVFSIKHKKWEYENEYRIIKYSKNGFDDDKRKLPLKIKAVYFGEKMEDNYKDIIIPILKRKNIPYYNISRNNNIFDLYK